MLCFRLCCVHQETFDPLAILIPMPSSISGRMTVALSAYSAVFMRYALAVSPKNYLLFGCHFINFSSQITQGYRYYTYWKYVFVTGVAVGLLACVLEPRLTYLYSMGGRELALKARAKEGLATAEDKAKQAVDKVTAAVSK